MPAEPRKFDFREIAALDDSAVALKNWISKTSSFFSEFWDSATGYSAQVSIGEVNTNSYGKTLEGISKEDTYCVVEIKELMSTMWYASPDEFRIIAGELLCRRVESEAEEEGKEEADASEAEGEEDADAKGDTRVADLSPIESALITLFIEKLADSLTSGWLGDQSLSVVASEMDKDPHKTLLFRQRDLVTTVDIVFDLQSQRAKIHWLFPKQSMADLLGTLAEQRSQDQPKKPTVEMASRLPIEVVAVLGETAIPMTDLTKLERGQLIRLDQRIDQPIMAYVNDEPYYQCWPGKIGASQSVEIVKCLRNDSIGGANE